MPQHDLDIANGSGAAVRVDLNNALVALGSSMKGPNAPPAAIAGMVWVDDDTPSATIWTIKQYDGAEWIELGRLDITNNIYIPSEGVIAWADVASAATVDLGAQASRSLRITGTTTITSFGTAANGVRRYLRFAAALTLTHNATSLILPGGATITTAAGDTATAISLGSGNWLVADFMPANGWKGAPVVLATATASTSATLDITTNLDSTYDRYELELIDLIPVSGANTLLLRIGTGAGPTWQAGATAYARHLRVFSISGAAESVGADTSIYLTNVSQVGTIAGGGVSGTIRFYTPSATKFPGFEINTVFVLDASNSGAAVGGGFYRAATAITGIRIFFVSGNISSGSIRLLGYRK